MPQRYFLDLSTPAAAVLSASGLTPTALAAELGVRRPAVNDATSRGDRISVAALRRFAEAAGFSLKIVVERKSPRPA